MSQIQNFRCSRGGTVETASRSSTATFQLMGVGGLSHCHCFVRRGYFVRPPPYAVCGDQGSVEGVLQGLTLPTAPHCSLVFAYSWEGTMIPARVLVFLSTRTVFRNVFARDLEGAIIPGITERYTNSIRNLLADRKREGFVGCSLRQLSRENMG